ncbi:MAG: hypothetical protein J5727_00590 [Kiritimatiellae bacterium]|nr:hypothetical protein [Kiritimatiellia bacterium]
MADDNMNSVAGSVPPPANPISQPRASTLKLKPVIRKPTIGATGATKPSIHPGMKLPTQPPAAKSDSAAPAEQSQPGALEQLKSVTQKLKGVTQEIPQQAILRKTGIIADQDLSEAQKQASKSRTARISLSDALGVAPVQNEAAPIKTIRIKRPDAIAKPAMSAPAAAAAPAPAAPAPAVESPAEKAAEPAAAAPTLTQRKTLKIARPGAVRPSAKFGIKKPGATATHAAPAPAAGAAAGADGGNVADIPDIPDMPAAAPAAPAAPAVPANAVPSLGKGATITGIVFQLAACVVVGALAYYLYLDAKLPLFCGGCGWGP